MKTLYKVLTVLSLAFTSCGINHLAESNPGPVCTTPDCQVMPQPTEIPPTPDPTPLPGPESGTLDDSFGTDGALTLAGQRVCGIGEHGERLYFGQETQHFLTGKVPYTKGRFEATDGAGKSLVLSEEYPGVTSPIKAFDCTDLEIARGKIMLSGSQISAVLPTWETDGTFTKSDPGAIPFLQHPGPASVLDSATNQDAIALVGAQKTANGTRGSVTILRATDFLPTPYGYGVPSQFLDSLSEVGAVTSSEKGFLLAGSNSAGEIRFLEVDLGAQTTTELPIAIPFFLSEGGVVGMDRDGTRVALIARYGFGSVLITLDLATGAYVIRSVDGVVREVKVSGEAIYIGGDGFVAKYRFQDALPDTSFAEDGRFETNIKVRALHLQASLNRLIVGGECGTSIFALSACAIGLHR